MLNYLNNHRGGFFRFFNGGASYGDESEYGYDQQQQQQPLYQQQQYQQQYQPQQQYQQQQQQYQQQLQSPPTQSPAFGLDLGTIQSLAEAINSDGGINLSNLGSNLGLLGNLASLGSALGGLGGGQATTTKAPPKAPASSLGSNLSLLSNLGSQLGLGDTVSNLLTGIVGARFRGRKSRKLSKRSTEFNDETLEELLLSLGKEQASAEGETEDPPSKKRNLNKEIGDDATKEENAEKASFQKRKKYHHEQEKKEKLRAVEKLLGIQARIINKDEIQAEAEDRIVHGHAALHGESLLLNPIVFPDNFNQVAATHTQEANGLAFPEHKIRNDAHVPRYQNFVFPSGFQAPDSDRGGKALQFSHSSPIFQPAPQQVPFNKLQFPENFQNQDGIILDIPKPLPLEYYDRTKMIFPDRTGTGNLRFDNDVFEQNVYNQNQNQNLIRLGRILTGLSQSRPVSYQGNYNGNYGSSAAAAFNRGDVLIFHSNGNGQSYTNNNQQRPQFDFGNRYPLTNNQVNSNRYQVPQPQQTTNYYGGNGNNNNRYTLGNSGGNSGVDNSQKIYVTNSQGIVTHYLNERGEKIAV